MITPETFALPGEVFITNAIIYPNNTRELYELATIKRYSMYSTLRFQYANIVYNYGHGEVLSSEEFGYRCSNSHEAIGVAVYGVPE